MLHFVPKALKITSKHRSEKMCNSSDDSRCQYSICLSLLEGDNGGIVKNWNFSRTPLVQNPFAYKPAVSIHLLKREFVVIQFHLQLPWRRKNTSQIFYCISILPGHLPRASLSPRPQDALLKADGPCSCGQLCAGGTGSASRQFGSNLPSATYQICDDE